MSSHPAESFLPGAKLSKALAELFIVDMDVHVHETPGGLAPHCELPWRKALEYIDTLPAGYNDVPGFAPALNAWPVFPPGTTRRTTLTSVSEARKDLDDLGINVAVLFPDALLLHAAIKQPDYAVALARAYNRWLVDEWLTGDSGLKGAVIAPPHDAQAAAAEIRTYASHEHIVCVYLPAACVDPLYGSRKYDPIYDAAQETGLPVALHAVGTVHPAFPFNLHGFDTLFGAHVLAHAFSMIANLVSMIESGVPVRFPDLRIIFTEAGISWVPFVMLKMDKEYIERRDDVPFYKDRPSEYVRQSMFFATQPIEEPKRMRDLAKFVSLFELEDLIVFASDWPHHDFDHPAKVLQIPLEEEVKTKIMGANAARVLKLASGA